MVATQRLQKAHRAQNLAQARRATEVWFEQKKGERGEKEEQSRDPGL